MTWRGDSSYAGGQGNRAGERYMRLRLFDRIRRLAHSRRPPVEATPGVSGVQGRHRRSGRRRPAPGGPAPGGPAPGGPPALRAGAARARIRETPQEAARPVPAAPAPQAHWQETEEPAAAAARAE